jgi:hypothetical protein
MGHRVVIERIDSTDRRLDRHVEHDSRSRQYPVSAPTPADLKPIFWADQAPILDQQQLGGCVGFTGADILNTAGFTPVRAKFNGGQFYGDRDGINFYSLATHADNIAGAYPPDDTGSSGLGLAKALMQLGLIERYEHAFTWEHVEAAIMVGPLAMGTPWTNSMFNPGADGVIEVGEINQSTLAGGHEWSLRGLDPVRNLGLGRNHWSPEWNPLADGPKVPGEFWIPIPDIQKLLASSGDAVLLYGAGIPA